MKAVALSAVVLVLSAAAFGLLGVAAIASNVDSAPVLENPLDASYVVDVPGPVPVANPLDAVPQANPRMAARYDDGVEVKNAVITPPPPAQPQPVRQPFQPWRPARPWQVPAQTGQSQCSDGSCFSSQRGR